MSNAYISSSPMPFLYGIFVNLIISRKKAEIPFPHGVRKSLLLFIFPKRLYCRPRSAIMKLRFCPAGGTDFTKRGSLDGQYAENHPIRKHADPKRRSQAGRSHCFKFPGNGALQHGGHLFCRDAQ